jgi:hypothetical protein
MRPGMNFVDVVLPPHELTTRAAQSAMPASTRRLPSLNFTVIQGSRNSDCAPVTMPRRD